MATPAFRQASIGAIAQRQWADYRALAPGSFFAEDNAALSLDEAYAVQAEVARLRCDAGDAVAGYKVGCVGPGVVEQFGMSGPIHARLFRSEMRASGQPVRHDGFANLAIEGEMALRIGADGVIAQAFPVIELHHFVFRGARKTLPELVANNGIHGGVVLPPEAAMRPLDFWPADARLTVTINGAVVDTGALWPMPGGAEASVTWLAGDLARRGAALRAGDLVLAGTPLGLFPVSPGDHVVVAVDGQRIVECGIA